MMKTYLDLLFSAALVLIAASSVLAQNDAPQNELEVRGSYLDLTGEASFTAPPVVGPPVSFEEDLRLPREPGFGLRYTYRSNNGRHKFLVDYVREGFEGSATLRRTVVFQGQVYPVNAVVDGKYELDDFRAMYAYRWGTQKFRIGPMADVGVVSSNVEIDATVNNIPVAAKARQTKFALTVGYDIEYNPTPRVNVFHTLGGIALGGDRLFRTEAGVRFFPIRNFGVSGGYKFAYYKKTDDPDFVLVNPRGPFIGGIVRF